MYTWSDSTGDFSSMGLFSSVEECIKEAKRLNKSSITIAEVKLPKISIDTDFLLERLSEEIYQEYGELAESWYPNEEPKNEYEKECFKKLQIKIDKIVTEFLRDTGREIDFYVIPINTLKNFFID